MPGRLLNSIIFWWDRTGASNPSATQAMDPQAAHRIAKLDEATVVRWDGLFRRPWQLKGLRRFRRSMSLGKFDHDLTTTDPWNHWLVREIIPQRP